MADNLSDQLALFNQYDSEYCSKATEVARKVQAAISLGPGKHGAQSQCDFHLDSSTARVSDLKSDDVLVQISEEEN